MPLILFGDKEKDPTDVINKGHIRDVGVVARRGEAVNEKVHPWNRSMMINHPHSWVYWSGRFGGVRCGRFLFDVAQAVWPLNVIFF